MDLPDRRVPPLTQEVLNRVIQDVWPSQDIAVRKCLGVEELDRRPLKAKPQFVIESWKEAGLPGIGPEPAGRFLTGSRRVEKYRTYRVTPLDRMTELELVKGAAEAMLLVELVVHSEDEPLPIVGVGVVETVALNVDSIANSRTGIVGQRRLVDEGLHPRIRSYAAQREQIDRPRLAVGRKISKISRAGGRCHDLADHTGRRRRLLFLVIQEEKELILQDRSAEVESVLMVEAALLPDSGGVVEKRVRVECVVFGGNRKNCPCQSLLPERVTMCVCDAPSTASAPEFEVVMLNSWMKLSLSGIVPKKASVRMKLSWLLIPSSVKLLWVPRVPFTEAVRAI